MRSIALLTLVACVSVPVRASSGSTIGEVDAASLAALTAQINGAPSGEFALYFNSPGGSVFDGLDFIRTMEKAQARGVVFVCTAEFAASMGAVIYSACDVRLAIPRALIMIHSASVMSQGTADDLVETAHTLEVVSDAMFRQIARVLTISFEELKARAGTKDYWLDVGRAMDIGLVQRVLP